MPYGVVIYNEKPCSTTSCRHLRSTTVLDDPEEEKPSLNPSLTTLCQKIPSAPCLTTPRRHSRLLRGTVLLPVVEHPSMPYSTTSCRNISFYGMLDGALPENHCCAGARQPPQGVIQGRKSR